MIPHADARKPNKAEPWRYITPCCGRQPSAHKNTRKYRCQGCGETYAADELVDQKDD